MNTRLRVGIVQQASSSANAIPKSEKGKGMTETCKKLWLVAYTHPQRSTRVVVSVQRERW